MMPTDLSDALWMLGRLEGAAARAPWLRGRRNLALIGGLVIAAAHAFGQAGG